MSILQMKIINFGSGSIARLSIPLIQAPFGLMHRIHKQEMNPFIGWIVQTGITKIGELRLILMNGPVQSAACKLDGMVTTFGPTITAMIAICTLLAKDLL